MNDIFGRVTAMLIAAAILCGMPLVYMQERLKSASQMYLLSESTRFVDNICNTGFLSPEMWEQFYRQIAPVEGICNIELMHETKELIYDETQDAYKQVSTFFDKQEILKQLGTGNPYPFFRNDYLRITICVENGITILPWDSDKTANVSYGGVIKYEAY